MIEEPQRFSAAAGEPNGECGDLMDARLRMRSSRRTSGEVHDLSQVEVFEDFTQLRLAGR
jgi:hypothetical protein